MALTRVMTASEINTGIFFLSLSLVSLCLTCLNQSVFSLSDRHTEWGRCCCFHLPHRTEMKGFLTLHPPWRVRNSVFPLRASPPGRTICQSTAGVNISTSADTFCWKRAADQAANPCGAQATMRKSVQAPGVGFGGADSNYCYKCHSGTDKQAVMQNM